MRSLAAPVVLAATLAMTWSLAACSDSGAGTDGDPGSGGAGTTTAASSPVASTDGDGDGAGDRFVVPEGFTAVIVEVTRPDGTVEEICVWLADTDDERQRGLMHVTDLAGADGMLFAFDSTTDGQFWMYETPMPLSIAFFDADGAFVSAADMDPCVGRPGRCERYSAEGPYLHALEVAQGGLDDLGIGAGSRIQVVGGDRLTCPAA